MTNPDALDVALRELARTPILLVASDYDGTLAPIVENPAEARPHRESVAAMRTLAAMPDTHVALISGRSLRDLATLSRLPEEIHLVGSHGSEFDPGFAAELDPAVVALRGELGQELRELASRDPGFGIEEKPASIAFHYRNADPAVAAEVVPQILSGPAARDGVHLKQGKMVVELSVIETDKGGAVDRLRHLVAAEAVLFLGDDVTDEDAFARLTGPDLGVKIGDGETLATQRVGDTRAAAQVLARLCELREAWLLGAQAAPIHEHSLLSDGRAVALVTPDARITWMCLPAADSPSVFAELVGGPRAGHFSVRPANSDAAPISQRYVDETLILETRWAGLTVTDYLDASDGRPDEPAGRVDLIRVLQGTGRVRIDFAPRLDYGRAFARFERFNGWLRVHGATQPLELRAPGVEWTITEDGNMEQAHGEIELEGNSVVLLMRYGTDPGRDPVADEPACRASTASHWHDWAEHLDVPDLQAPAVRRSALTLKALCHQPTGSILAAATTSLPEELGGIRNWDYRYCWPRDAALSAAALVELGSTSEAVALLDWLLERIANLPTPDQLRPVYPLVGDALIPEAVLPTLSGYGGSRPVRIGNAAESQVQLDVFGPIVDLVDRLSRRRGHTVSDAHWELVGSMVDAVRRRWDEPDHGIWEERRPQRHHVHSKVMCWQAVDRAIAIGRRTNRDVPASWRPLRHMIAADVIVEGWNDQVSAYTACYGEDGLDAAALHIGLSGLLPPTDARFVSTIKAIERELRRGPVVYRYHHDDGLPGSEGGFLLCTSWLIQAYALSGLLDDAHVLFRRYVDLAGHTGLLSEEYDPDIDVMLGNHPQAYSHLGLINAAVTLANAGS